MSFLFSFRRIGGGYLGATVSVGGGTFDLGLLDPNERSAMASDLRSAADELLPIDNEQTEAYAEGRADERAEWLPVLEALKTLVARIEFYSAMGAAAQPNIEQWEYTEGSSDMKAARAAIASVEGKS